MKSIVLSSVITALLVLSGCSDKEPEVMDPETTKQEVKKVEAVKTEVVAVNQSIVNNSTVSMVDTEAELASIYFAFDKFTISNEMQTKVSMDAGIAKNEASKYKIKLEGNCDEWGSDEYNFALGLKRADAVKKALVAEGVSASSISMVTYGESNPVCLDRTQYCWDKNRRVDFILLP